VRGYKVTEQEGGILAAQLVRYKPPQYLVEPVGEPSAAEDLAAINAADWDIIEATLGWEPYNAIIEVTGASGETYAYLALVAE